LLWADLRSAYIRYPACTRPDRVFSLAFWQGGRFHPASLLQNASFGRTVVGRLATVSTITPVNSFRVVLNEVFDLHLPLLEDRIYYSPWSAPYQLEDITQQIETKCETPKKIIITTP
jgi:hypothetical protein